MSEERKAAERLAVKGVLAALMIGLAVWGIPQIWDKMSPFIIAIPLASMLQPVIRFASDRLKVKRGATVLVCILLMLGILFGFSYWVVALILEQAPEVVGQSGSMISETINTLQQAAQNLMVNISDNVTPQVQDAIRNALNDALSRAGQWGTQLAADAVKYTLNFVTGLPYGVIYISFAAMALYFISIHYGEIRSYLPGGNRRRQDSNTTQLTNSALKSLMGYLRVQGTFALMVLVVSLITLHSFGFKYASAMSLLAGIMEMIPMIGSGLMYILLGIVYLLIGDTAAGITVLILTGVLQLLRRLLEPKLMSDSIGISPLMSLIGMFVGMRIGGIVGLIGGPVAMSVLVGAVRGDVFKRVSDDIFLIVCWFKRRWADPETGEAAALRAEEAPLHPAAAETDHQPAENTRKTASRTGANRPCRRRKK